MAELVLRKKFSLDVKNKSLLYELELNSRTPLAKIARTILVSKEVAHYRLNRLMKVGFITHFEPIIDFYALGLKQYRLLINLQNMAYHVRNEIISEVKKIPRSDVIVYMSSDWDIEVDVWVNTSQTFYAHYHQILEKYAEYIGDREFYVITKVHYFGHRHLYNKDLDESVLCDGALRKDIDEHNHKLLLHLRTDARQEVLTLAGLIKMGAAATHSRMQHLVRCGILHRVVPVLDTSMLGFNTYRISLVLGKPSEKNKFISYLHSQKQVVRIYELIGKKDLDVEVEFATTLELDGFLERLRLELPYIKDFEVINILNPAQGKKGKGVGEKGRGR